MTNKEELQTFFLHKPDFDRVKDRLNFENNVLLEDFSPEETDVIALDFTINSPPLVKHLEVVKGGDFVPFWLERFKKEGVTQEQLFEAFSKLNE